MAKVKITKEQAERLGLQRKKKLIITKEQYNRVSKLMTESFPTSETAINHDGLIDEVIKYVYGKAGFPKELADMGHTEESFRQMLVGDKMVVETSNGYAFSKSYGDAAKIREGIRMVLDRKDHAQTPESDVLMSEDDVSNYKVIYLNRDLALVSDGHAKYLFFYDDIEPNTFADYMDSTNDMYGKDEDGFKTHPDNSDIIPDKTGIEGFLNANHQHLTKGEGLQGYNDGADIVKLDDQLKDRVVSLYSMNKPFVNILTQVGETTSAASSGQFTAPLFSEPIRKTAEKVITEFVGDDTEYTHYCLDLADNKIVKGWDYSDHYDHLTKKYDQATIGKYATEDLRAMPPTQKPKSPKLLTFKNLLRMGIDPVKRINWK